MDKTFIEYRLLDQLGPSFTLGGAVNVEVDVGVDVDVDHLTAQFKQVVGALVQAALPKLKLMLVLILTSKLQ